MSERARRPPAEAWPALPYGAWKETCTTLHLWTQIVGKVKLARTPLVNHWWNVTLFVTDRGLTTGWVSLPARFAPGARVGAR